MNNQGYVQLITRLTPAAKHRLKLHAVSTGQTMNALVEWAVEEIVRREALGDARVSAAARGGV